MPEFCVRILFSLSLYNFFVLTNEGAIRSVLLRPVKSGSRSTSCCCSGRNLHCPVTSPKRLDGSMPESLPIIRIHRPFALLFDSGLFIFFCQTHVLSRCILFVIGFCPGHPVGRSSALPSRPSVYRSRLNNKL